MSLPRSQRDWYYWPGWESWGSETLINLPRVTQQLSARANSPPRPFWHHSYKLRCTQCFHKVTTLSWRADPSHRGSQEFCFCSSQGSGVVWYKNCYQFLFPRSLISKMETYAKMQSIYNSTLYHKNLLLKIHTTHVWNGRMWLRVRIHLTLHLFLFYSHQLYWGIIRIQKIPHLWSTQFETSWYILPREPFFFGKIPMHPPI